MWPRRRQKIFLQIEGTHLGQPLFWISYTINWKKEIWSNGKLPIGLKEMSITSNLRCDTQSSAFPLSFNCLNQKEKGVKHSSARETADYVNGKTFRGGGAVYWWEIMSFYPFDLFTWTWRVLVYCGYWVNLHLWEKMMHTPPKETEYSQLQIHFKIFRKKKMSPEHRLVCLLRFLQNLNCKSLAEPTQASYRFFWDIPKMERSIPLRQSWHTDRWTDSSIKTGLKSDSQSPWDPDKLWGQKECNRAKKDKNLSMRNRPKPQKG